MSYQANRKTEMFTFSGDVNKPDFIHWISHRAHRLGLNGWVRDNPIEKSIDVLASGPEELLDAMELGCSLGPITVWVEDVVRCPHETESPVPDGFEILAPAD